MSELSKVKEIFVFWQKTFNHPRARLDNTRRRKIEARLRDGYSVDEIKSAILGCKASPFHQGENEFGLVYDDIS
ncbi:phage replication protein, partial [Escherichia coli]|nr:phage replication protein [Escherichia coli]